jgi:hypothetical protein
VRDDLGEVLVAVTKNPRSLVHGITLFMVSLKGGSMFPSRSSENKATIHIRKCSSIRIETLLSPKEEAS